MTSVQESSRLAGQRQTNQLPPLGKRGISKQSKSASHLSTLNTSTLSIDTSDHLRPSPRSAGSEALLSFNSRSPIESRQKLRDHLFGESHSSLSPVDISDDDGQEKKGMSGGFKQKVARTSTMISKRASIRLPLGLSKASSRLSLIDGAGEEGDVVNEIRQKAMNDSNNAYHHNSKGKDRTKDSAPIRRRSLFTPGLATRHPEDPLRKPPASTDGKQEFVYDSYDRTYYYNSGLSETSPLERLAALDLADSRQGTPAPRSATPTDIDYGLLGSGLRVTNGMASPIPSIRSTIIGSRSTTPRARHMESFYTVSEGGTSLDELTLPESLRTRIPTASPLRVAQSIESLAFDENKENEPRFMTGKEIQGGRRDRSSTLAMEYIADLPTSPFAFHMDLNKPLPLTPASKANEFAATSKANEFEDELFEDRTATPSPVSEKSANLWQNYLNEDDKIGHDSAMLEADTLSDLNRMMSNSSLSKHDLGTSSELITSTQSGNSGVTTWTTSSSENGSVKTTTTTTSAPVISVTRTALAPRPYPVQIAKSQERPDLSPADSGYYSSASSKEEVRKYPLNRAPAPVRAIVERRQTPVDFAAISYESLDSRTDRTVPIMRPVKLHGSQSAQVLPSKTPQSHPSANTIQTLSSPQESDGRLVLARKKLRKKSRPRSMPPPIDRGLVQRDLDVSTSFIPPVPLDVAERHARRSQDFPTLGCTVPNIGRAPSRQDFSEPVTVSEPLNFPSPSPSRNQQRRVSRKLFSGHIFSFSANMDESHAPGIQTAPLKPSKGEKRASRQLLDVDESPVFAHFGDVIDYLGHGPYDAAAMSRPAGHRPTQTERFHPHHMTTSLPKSKSMVGMDEAQATEINRMRCQYRNKAHNQAEQAIASPSELPSPPSTSMGIYLPGRLDDHDRGWQTDRAAASPPMPTAPMPPQVTTLEQQSFRQERDHPAYNNVPARSANKPDWTAHGAAWAQRRQQADAELQGFPAPAAFPQEHGRVERMHSPYSASAIELRTRLSPELSTPPPPPPSRGQSSLSVQDIGAQEGITARMAAKFEGGRFEGGLGYGYEPGFGVNGSAGTRGLRSNASRKSVPAGQKYGIDLTDIPVFVAPMGSS